jgi:hypothetical protein
VADEHSWQVELERGELPALQARFEWALQHQNRRFAGKFERAVPQRGLRGILIGVAILGLVVIGLYVALDPRAFGRDPWFVIGYGAVFTAVLVIGIVFTPARKSAFSARWSGRSFARAAERTFRPVLEQLPYTIDYRLAGDAVEARVAKLGLVRRTELAKVRLVLDGETVLFAFRRPGSFNPYRLIYVPAAADRDAVLAAFARRGAEHVVLTGPIDGYVAPVPEARVRSGT